jgi:hypothetical protein
MYAALPRSDYYDGSVPPPSVADPKWAPWTAQLPKSILQAYYALERLIAVAGEHQFLISEISSLRSRGSLTTNQLNALEGWFANGRVLMPAVAPLVRPN